MKQFSIFGKTVKIDKNRHEYNKYRRLFLEMASQARDEFCKAYNKNESLDDVVKHAPEQMEACVTPGIDYCIQQLVDRGILSYDTQRLEEEYHISDIWGSAYLKIQDQYAEIAMNEEQLSEYRTARRQNRSRWSGGGFGVPAAIQASVTAGAMNMVSGAGHMIFNGVSGIITSAISESKRKKIFKDPATFETLSRGVFTAVYMLHYALIDCLEKGGVTSAPAAGIVSDDEEREAQTILNNVDKIQKKEMAADALIQALQLDPYSKMWYQTAMRIFGDKTQELERMADYFCVYGLLDMKADLLAEFADSLSVDTEEQATQALRCVQEKKKELGFNYETPETEKICQAVEDFDAAYRTVDEILHKTRKEADDSRRDLEHIREIENSLDRESMESLLNAIEQIKSMTSAAAAKHADELSAEREALSKRLRAVDTHLGDNAVYLCADPETAEKLRPIVNKLYQQLLHCSEDEQPDARLLELKEKLAAENIPDEVRKKYGTEIDIRLHAIEAAPRTALGKEYSSVEERKQAEGTYRQLEKEADSVASVQAAKAVWKRVEKEDFSEEASAQLLKKLYGNVSIKRAKSTKRYKIILAFIVLVSLFFTFSVSFGYVEKDYTIMGNHLLNTHFEIDTELGLLDGVKNGILVCGRTLGDSLIGMLRAYISGFDHGLIGNALWLLLGWVYVVIKYMLLLLARYPVMLLSLLFMKAGILYYPGYLIPALITGYIMFRALADDEDEEKELEEFKKQLSQD